MSGLGDRIKALGGRVLGKKMSSLILSRKTLHIGRDALHRDPSPCERPLAIFNILRKIFLRVLCASSERSERVVNSFFLVLS
jgi:hypothetical protein